MNESAKTYRPSLAFFHPNAKGTGAAVKLNLHPAHDDTDGCIMLTAAAQMTVGDVRSPNPVFPRFDWESAICVKLDFTDLCQFLQVLRGECETAGDERGLYHRTAKAATRIVLRHLVEPAPGYSLELYRTPASGEGESHARIFFTPAEALGLCESIAGSMSVISFGIPVVVPHDTSAYRAAQKGRSDVRAA